MLCVGGIVLCANGMLVLFVGGMVLCAWDMVLYAHGRCFLHGALCMWLVLCACNWCSVHLRTELYRRCFAHGALCGGALHMIPCNVAFGVSVAWCSAHVAWCCLCLMLCVGGIVLCADGMLVLFVGGMVLCA